MKTKKTSAAFTLIELLLTISVILLLLAIILPGIKKARLAAKMVVAHSDLRQITIAIDMYRDDNNTKLPPTRGSCNLRAAYDLPPELIKYLIENDEDSIVETVGMKDPFTGSGYLYRAPGCIIMNETTIVENGSTIWVQEGFPYGDCRQGRYYNDPKESPVRYAVWSSGPQPHSRLFDIPGRLPVPHIYWLSVEKEEGVVVHLEDSEGNMHISP